MANGKKKYGPSPVEKEAKYGARMRREATAVNNLNTLRGYKGPSGMNATISSPAVKNQQIRTAAAKRKAAAKKNAKKRIY